MYFDVILTQAGQPGLWQIHVTRRVMLKLSQFSGVHVGCEFDRYCCLPFRVRLHLHLHIHCRYSWPRSRSLAPSPRFRLGADYHCTCWLCRWGLLSLFLAVVLHCDMNIVRSGPGVRLFRKYCHISHHAGPGAALSGNPHLNPNLAQDFPALACFDVPAFMQFLFIVLLCFCVTI
jgi:hypothetical protein